MVDGEVMDLYDFISESNRIEGIREVLSREIDAHEAFLALPNLLTADVEAFVAAVAPGHVLRREVGLNVRVGKHIAPSGGPEIERALKGLLGDANAGYDDAYNIHVKYETLHPFTDGNGRSGRAIWAWQMLRQYGPMALNLGFLHRFYYQTLEHSRPCRHRSPSPQRLRSKRPW